MVVRIYPTYSYKTKPYTNDTGDENNPFPVTQQAVKNTVTTAVDLATASLQSSLAVTVSNNVQDNNSNPVTSSGVKSYVDGKIKQDFLTTSQDTIPSTSAVKNLVDNTTTSINSSNVIPAVNSDEVVTSDAVVNYVNARSTQTVNTSTTKLPTSNAVKSYVDDLIVGLEGSGATVYIQYSSGSDSIQTTNTIPTVDGDELPTSDAVVNYFNAKTTNVVDTSSKLTTSSAVKSYVDTAVANGGGGNGSLTSTSVIPATTGTDVPTSDAVETYINAKTSTVVDTTNRFVTSNAVKNYVDTVVANTGGGGNGSSLTSTSTIPASNGTYVTTSDSVVTYISSKTATIVDTSNRFPTSNAVKSYVDTAVGNGGGNGSLTSTSVIPATTGTDVPTSDAVVNYINNKTSTSVGTSNDKLPTELAVKSYVDTAVANGGGGNGSLTSTSVIPATTGTDVPTSDAVVNYINNKTSTNVSDNNTNFPTTKAVLNHISLITSTNVSDNNTNLTTSASVKTYVDNEINAAQLGGNADVSSVIPAPSGTDIVNSTAVVNYIQGMVSTDINDNNTKLSTTKAVMDYFNDKTATNIATGDTTDFPTVQSVKTYVDTEVDTVEALINNNFVQISNVQDTVDSDPASSNLVTSSGIKAYVDNAVSNINIDVIANVSSGSSQLVTSDGIYNFVEAMVAGIESGTGSIATIVQDNNNDPVTSNAVYDHIHDPTTGIITTMNNISTSKVPSTHSVSTFVSNSINNALFIENNLYDSGTGSSGSGTTYLITGSGIVNFVDRSLAKYDAHVEDVYVSSGMIDNIITQNSTNLVTSSGIYNWVSAQINSGVGNIEFSVIQGNNNAVSSNAVYQFVTTDYVNKNDILTAVSSSVGNPISSSGIYNFVFNELDTFSNNYLRNNYVKYDEDVLHTLDTVSSGSNLLVTASGIWNYVEGRPQSGGLLSSGTDDIISLLPVNTVTVNSSTQYVFNNIPHDDSMKLGMNFGKYIFNIPSAHQIYFKYDDGNGNVSYNENIQGITINVLSGEEITGSINNGLDSGFMKYYYGEIQIEVTERFQPFSYVCKIHGYMGGQNRIVFSDKCTPPIDTSDIPFVSDMIQSMWSDPVNLLYDNTSSGSALPMSSSGIYEYVRGEIDIFYQSFTTDLVSSGDSADGYKLITSSGVYDEFQKYILTSNVSTYVDYDDVRDVVVTASGISNLVYNEIQTFKDTFVSDLNVSPQSSSGVTASGVWNYFKQNVTDGVVTDSVDANTIVTSGFTVILPPTVPVASYSNNTLTLDGSGKSYLYGTFTPNEEEINSIVINNSIIGTQFVIHCSGSGILKTDIGNDPTIKLPKTMDNNVSFTAGGGIISIFHAPDSNHYLSFVEY